MMHKRVELVKSCDDGHSMLLSPVMEKKKEKRFYALPMRYTISRE